MRRLLITLTVALGLLVSANPASAAAPTHKTEDRSPGFTAIRLVHGDETALAVIGVIDEPCDDSSEGASSIMAEAAVYSPGHRVSAGPIALVRGASVVRVFNRLQVATTLVHTNTHPLATTGDAIYRARATIGVRWRDRSLSRYTIWTKYTPTLPACDT